jgi:hypothetical protein
MKFKAQVTNTVGHEPAFTWVRNYILEIDEETTSYSMARKVKRLIGWPGKTTFLVEKDEHIEIRPYGEEEVCLIKMIRHEDGYLK